MKRLGAPPLAAALSAVLLTACLGPQPEPPDAPPERLECPEIGLAIAALPQVFQVVSNDAEGLVLQADGPARLVVAIGPEQRVGINLVREVQQKKGELEALSGAEYLGNRELMTPIGTAFTARATYEGEAGQVEETWIFAIHPSANRLLTLTYTYPTGQSEQRVQELIGVLGEIEGLGFRD